MHAFQILNLSFISMMFFIQSYISGEKLLKNKIKLQKFLIVKFFHSSPYFISLRCFVMHHWQTLIHSLLTQFFENKHIILVPTKKSGREKRCNERSREKCVRICRQHLLFLLEIACSYGSYIKWRILNTVKHETQTQTKSNCLDFVSYKV